MIFLTHSKLGARLVAIAVCAGVLSISARALSAAEAKTATTSGGASRSFASPDEAMRALQAAAEGKDKAALREIFGPQYDELATGDDVQDANNAQRFATVLAQGFVPLKEGEDRVTFEIGTNNWPMPIPLVKVDGQWRFDTAAGKAEIIYRHIGKDELHAIGVCRAFVTAERQYASAHFDGGNEPTFAQKFKSTPGKKDGLYWEVGPNEPPSPFGPLVAEAHAEGYGRKSGPGPKPFHGYYFRILTRQGRAASGGRMDYLTGSAMTKGFALVAYPEVWDQSGIMTFIVNQDGQIFQRNLGEKTARIAGALRAFNPDGDWTLVKDTGILDAVSEK